MAKKIKSKENETKPPKTLKKKMNSNGVKKTPSSLGEIDAQDLDVGKWVKSDVLDEYLTSEQLRLIESNRLEALERRRKHRLEIFKKSPSFFHSNYHN